MAATIEPRPEQLEAMGSIADVFRWAKIDGDLAHPGSMGGSLLRLMGLQPEHDGDLWQELAMFANIDPHDYMDEAGSTARHA